MGKFFDAFDSNNLAFLYQDKSNSRFSKLVDRSTVDVSARTRPAARKAASRKRSAASKKSSSRSSSKRSTSRSAVTTTNHSEIKRWAEKRGGSPTHVKRTGSRKDPGVLRIDYPGYSGKRSLEGISWSDWFNWFDRDKLAFLYQKTANSRFSKRVRR